MRPERFSDFRGSDDVVEIHVTDNGPGIPPDQQLHIFVPFFTTKQKGTGLGLAICQRIVKNHGGIDLRAEPRRRRHHLHHPPARAALRAAGGGDPAPRGHAHAGDRHRDRVRRQPRCPSPTRISRREKKKRRGAA